VIGLNEPVAAPCDPATPLGPGSDRRAVHYYRAQHGRAVQREQQWKQRALAAERIIAQLVVLVGGCVQQSEALKRQLAWLKKQQFGRKSEATPANGLAGSLAGATESSAAAGSGEGPVPDTEPVAGGGAGQTKRCRGQQPGGPGPKRQRRLHLPEQTTHHLLTAAERTCPICGKLRPASGLTEESEEVEWKVRLVRHRHVRHRYGPSCDCPSGRGIRTAPKPAKLIPKGLFAVSFWVEVLLKKFEWAQPLHRTVRELKAHGLEVSPGTLSGGLQKLKDLVVPLAGQFVLHSREGSHWQMDETRWPMYGLAEGQPRRNWWFWVVVTPEVTAFLLEPTRSGQVPQDFFAPGTAGIVNVDRYAGYFALLGADWQLQLAYCWSHQRRDFVNLGEGCPRWAGWAGAWIERINRLFAYHGQRRQAWFQKQAQPLAALEQEVRRQVQEMKGALERELAGGQLAGEPEKILQSMRRHWSGLTVFVDHPHVPMDNNAAERANRPLAVGRKNYYGSGSEWSGELAGACFTILATLRQHQICPRRYLQSYLEACARAPGRPGARSAGSIPALEMEPGTTGGLAKPGASAMSAEAGRRFQLTSASAPRAPVRAALQALEPLVFQRVPGGRLSQLWNELIARYHYLGYRPLSGAQMRYLVWSADGQLLATLGFGASAWQVQPRDRHIGWTDRQRRAGLHRIVNNARFLILPWVQCGGLASRILSGIVKPLRADWRWHYGYEPVLLETFVEIPRFTGTSYRAANWIRLGQTRGRGKLEKQHCQIGPLKDIWVYPLHRNFRKILCAAS